MFFSNSFHFMLDLNTYWIKGKVIAGFTTRTLPKSPLILPLLPLPFFAMVCILIRVLTTHKGFVIITLTAPKLKS